MNLDRIIAVRTNKTVYRDGDFAIKVFDRDYSKADVLSEALNQARVEDCGLFIPKIIEVKMMEGRWVMISEFIKGKTLDRIMSENPEKEDFYLDMFVSLQMEVHSKCCPHLARLKDKLNLKICESELDATARYDLHTRLAEAPRHSKLCHGDFNPSNIIISDREEPYILDWSHASQGNASADAAQTYLLLSLDGKRELAEKYAELFCQKSGTQRQYIDTWIPIMAAAYSVSCRPENKETLLRWAKLTSGTQTGM